MLQISIAQGSRGMHQSAVFCPDCSYHKEPGGVSKALCFRFQLQTCRSKRNLLLYVILYSRGKNSQKNYPPSFTLENFQTMQIVKIPVTVATSSKEKLPEKFFFFAYFVFLLHSKRQICHLPSVTTIMCMIALYKTIPQKFSDI